MDIATTAENPQSLERFRHLLFHLQMELGSIQQVFERLSDESKIPGINDLEKIDPLLVSQILAREQVLEAQKTADLTKAVSLLETALNLDPDCAEACLEMASRSQTSESAMMWYQRSMDASIRLTGEERQAELEEEFRARPWRQLETKNYFKAKVHLAEKLYRSGHYEVAILHFREILELNPGDELGLRNYLLASYIAENLLEDARALCRKYRDDWSATWYYLRAMLRFREEGDTRRSRRALSSAFQRNLWTPVFLLGLEELPPEREAKHSQKPSFKISGRAEAAACARCIGTVFCEDSQLIYWVWKMLKETAAEELTD